MNSHNPQRTSPRLSSSSPKILSASREFSFTDGIINDEHSQSSFIPENTSHSFQNSDSGVANSTIMNLSFHIHKLDLLYQSLEGRVQKLESFVDDHMILNGSANHISPPMQRKRNFSDNDLVINSNVDVNNGSLSINNNNMSNSISNSNLLKLNLSNLSSFLQLDSIQKDDILKADLDDYCLPLLQKKATPSIGELNSIVMSLKKLKYPDFDNKFILSKVREWFRRKREYMSQRINNVCTKMFSNLADSSVKIEIKDLIKQARNNPSITSEIAREANLEIVNEAAALEFCREKISSYLDNLSSSLG